METMEDIEDIQDIQDTQDIQDNTRNIQNVLVYNELLPYKDIIADEANTILCDIKNNLAASVLARETIPGISVWTANLIKYIKLYGLRFSKEDHIRFVNLLFELVTVPNLDPSKMQKYAILLVLLTKKQHLLTPEDLEIPWRPLYDIGRKIFYKKSTLYHYVSNKRDINMDDDDKDDERNAIMIPQKIRQFLEKYGLQMPSQASTFEQHESLEDTFEKLVICLKPYFPVSATREILDELLPQYNPLYTSGVNTEILAPLMLFLPYTPAPKDIDKTFKLWLEPLMTTWKTIPNTSAFDSELLTLLAYTAQNNISYIDWEPHMAFIFTKVLRSFNFPVFYKRAVTIRHFGIDTHYVAIWIANVLGGGSSAQKYLDEFMTVIASYLQNANHGKWSIKLRDFMKRLTLQVVARLHRERSNYKKTWLKPTPESHRLTDEDIDAFVQCILNVALQSTFTQTGITDICTCLQNLAILRPSMVILPTINKMYSTLDSLTEPHKFTCALQCVVSVAGPLINGFNNGFPEGPTHVIPLLFACLPGLDPNDFRKTILTLNFISYFCTLILLVDCSGASQYWPNLTEEEQTVCEATAQAEDFVVQFFDKIFGLIDSSTLENTRMEHSKDSDPLKNNVESASETALTSTTTCVLMQTSTPIFKMALKKMFAFVSDRILETNVAGMTAALVCKSFARVNATETLKLFIPYLCDSLSQVLNDSDVLKEENLDNSILFNLLLLSHLVECDGQVLIKYVPTILNTVDDALKLTCTKGWKFACRILCCVLSSLSNVDLKECKSSKKNYDESIETFLPIREWGKPGNIWKAKLKWHVPNDSEIQCVKDIINKYFPVELAKLNKYVDGELELTREELNKSLFVIKGLLAAKPLLCPLQDDEITLVESRVRSSPVFTVNNGINGNRIKDQNFLVPIYDIMQSLQTKLLDSNEDDTKNFETIISIWEQLVLDGNKSSHYESMAKNFNSIKRILENKLIGRPGHPRCILAQRAALQHQFRCYMNVTPFTKYHAKIMSNLLILGTSRYSYVRIMAQSRLNTILAKYPYSYYSILPQLVECLGADPETEHEKLKGALFCAFGSKQKNLVAKHEWKVVSVLWPAIIFSKPSEKLSIVKLLEFIMHTSVTLFPTVAIIERWSDSITEAGKALLSPEQLQDSYYQSLLAEGEENLNKSNELNKTIYLNLLNDLFVGMNNTKLQWRYSMMCVSLLPNLTHEDVAFPSHGVKITLQYLIHENIYMRKLALRVMVLVLKQMKKESTKVEVNPYEMAGLKEEPSELIPGYREDNLWLQHDMNKEFTEEEWDNTPYTHRNKVGFFGWQKPFMMSAPPVKQPTCTLDNMNENEREIYNFFNDDVYLTKFIKFMSMEEKKERDKFAPVKFSIFKKLFSHFGDLFFDKIKEHLKKLTVDKTESSQRCAAEIIAGIIRGSKHWTYQKVSKVRTDILPIIKCALESMTTETLADWGTCFATATLHMDLTRINWLIRELENPIAGVGSAKENGRLYCLQSATALHVWRGALNSQRVLNDMKNKNMLYHPYQIIRERIASFLVNIFEMDVMLPNGRPPIGPRVVDFMKEVEEKMDALLIEGVKGVSKENGTHCCGNSDPDNIDVTRCVLQPHQKDVAHNIFQTLTSSSSTEEKRSTLIKLVAEARELKFHEDAKLNSLLKLAYTVIYVKKEEEDMKDISSQTPLDDIENDLSRMQLDTTSEVQETEFEINVRLFKIVLRWVASAISRSGVSMRSSFYVLFPAACLLASREDDEELNRVCSGYLGAMCHGLHNKESLEAAFDAVEKVCQSPSWGARSRCISYLQSMVFQNLPIVYSWDKEFKVKKIILTMMNDVSPEVREEAGKMMSGLLHCGVIDNPTEILEYFKSQCKGKKLNKGPGASEALVKRHCGVLGLCAFVAAHPYSVPPYLPEIFAILCKHLNDPLPIRSSIHTTLCNFKRTHHEDWENHKLKFTEEELNVLSDLSVPPSYYA